MRYELDDHPEDYHSLIYEYWCDLLSIIEVKYERKRAADHIKLYCLFQGSLSIRQQQICEGSKEEEGQYWCLEFP